MGKNFFIDLKHRIIDYAHHLTIYDYFAYSWVIILFIFLIILTFIFIKKRQTLSAIIFLFSIILLISSPFIIKIYFDKTVKKIEIINKDEKKLKFAKMLIIKGEIKSKAKIDFRKCRIFAKVFKISENKYKNILYSLKPKRYLSILINKPLKRGKTLPFKVIFRDFHEENYKTKIYGECY